MENNARNTHNLAAAIYDLAARLNNKADTIAENVEPRGPSPACPTPEVPPPMSANDVLNRAVDRLLQLENTLEHIYESVGSIYQGQKQAGTPDPSAKATATSYMGGQQLRR